MNKKFEASEQQKTFVRVFLDESSRTGDYRLAAEAAKKAAGYSEHSHVRSILGAQGVKDLLMEEVTLELAQKIPKLLFRIEEVVDNPNLPGAKRIIDACIALLDRAGIVKVDKSEIKVDAPDGVIMIPMKNNNTTENKE